MSDLEIQLRASVLQIELRGATVKELVAHQKAVMAELLARRARVRKDAADLHARKAQLKRDAADLSAAGLRVKPRIERKDKGSKRAPKLRALPPYDASQGDPSGLKAELNALDQKQDDADLDGDLQRSMFNESE